MRITAIFFIIFSLIVQGHGRPLPGPGSKYSGVHPLMRRLPGKKESAPAAWFRETSDRFWNSVIPGRPTLAKVVMAGTSLIVIALGLGLWLFIYVYRKFHPEYLQVEEELFKGKRVMRPDSPTGLLSMMLHKPVPEKHHAVKKHRDIEEGDDVEEQRRALSDWLIAASNYMVEKEQEREESEDDSAADKGVKSKAVKKYVAKRVKKLTNQLKDKTVAIKKEVKQAKNIMATKTKNIKVKEAKNILAKKTRNIMAKKTKNIKVKKAKNMAKKTKNIMVKKIKKLKRRK